MPIYHAKFQEHPLEQVCRSGHDLPTGVEPVNVTTSTSGWVVSSRYLHRLTGDDVGHARRDVGVLGDQFTERG